MATTDINDIVNYHHVRELKPAEWVDQALNARTPAPGVEKPVLVIRRSDGVLQKWIFAPTAYYAVTGNE